MGIEIFLLPAGIALGVAVIWTVAYKGRFSRSIKSTETKLEPKVPTEQAPSMPTEQAPVEASTFNLHATAPAQAETPASTTQTIESFVNSASGQEAPATRSEPLVSEQTTPQLVETPVTETTATPSGAISTSPTQVPSTEPASTLIETTSSSVAEAIAVDTTTVVTETITEPVENAPVAETPSTPEVTSTTITEAPAPFDEPQTAFTNPAISSTALPTDVSAVTNIVSPVENASPALVIARPKRARRSRKVSADGTPKRRRSTRAKPTLPVAEPLSITGQQNEISQ